MKRLLDFVFLAFLMMAVSCSKELEGGDEPAPIDPSGTLSPDSALVRLNATLDTTEPLTKAASTDDLYRVIVYEITTNEEGNTVPVYVAHGTFDDLSKVAMKMHKKVHYAVDVAYVKDGKRLVHQYEDGHYGVPFDAVWTTNGKLNELVYLPSSETGKLWPLNAGAVQEKGITDYKIDVNTLSSIVRYQGSALCDPSKDTTVNVKLYQQMIGFRIKITDFKEGKVSLSTTYGHVYAAEPDQNQTGLIDIVVTMPEMPTARDMILALDLPTEAARLEYALKPERVFYTSLQLTYTAPSGEQASLYTDEFFAYQRNKRYALEFSLDEALKNGGIPAQDGNLWK